MKYNNPLLDKEFLRQLDKQPIRNIYARITALTKDESPIECLEGRITGGNINVDGNSAVRRTCSITLIAEEVNINNFYWGLNNKIKVEIGVSNKVNDLYPDIIWFKQGIFLITTFNTTLANNNYTINISGKDKMCLLNGEIGGSLPASINFGVIDTTLPDGTIIEEDVPLKTIIKELLYSWGEEPYHNIIINDLEDCGIELLKYNGDEPLYFYVNDTNVISNLTINGETKIGDTTLSSIPDDNLYDGASPQKYDDYYIMKRQSGESVGYRETELTYAGELISSVGETITSILDKIKKMLGDFEYFYDIDGRFVFQRQQTYQNTSWNPMNQDSEGETYIDSSAENTSVIYSFDDSQLITSFTNNPNLLNLKNDFSVWGQKKTTSGASEDALLIHMRYAIDTKPQEYRNYDGEFFTVNSSDIATNDTKHFGLDWREIIYQMAIDYRKNNQKHDFLSTIAINNPIAYPKGYTGYEKYYTDMEGFWRQIYNPYPILEEPSNDIDQYYVWDENGEIQTYYFDSNIINFKDNIDWTKYYILDSETEEYKQLEEAPKMPDDTYDTFYTFKCTGQKVFPVVFRLYRDPEGNFYEDENSSKTVNKSRKFYDDALTGTYKENMTTKIFFSTDDKGLNITSEQNKTYMWILKDNRKDDNEDITDFTNIRTTVIQNAEFLYTLDRAGKLNISQQEAYESDTGYCYWVAQELIDQETVMRENFESERIKTLQQNYYLYENGEYKKDNLLKFTGDLATVTVLSSPNFYLDNHFNRDVYEAPYNLRFWFDFLDTSGELGKYQIQTIGDRPKVINDTNINSLYYKEIPTVIFTDDINSISQQKTGYTYINIPQEQMGLFSISAQGLSAKEKIEELLYTHSYCIESTTIQTIPIYYLEPNNRIYLADEKSNIKGDYIISKITVPLTYNGTMSITATKAVNRII